ncbi:MAG: DUF4258 domain-containing protein [Thermomicrobiales bacterium]
MLDNGTLRPIRWTPHTLENLSERTIDPREVELTIDQPEFVVPGRPPRTIFMRRYHDAHEAKEMLVRVVVEDTATERVIVTVVKASRMNRYLRGRTP